MNIRTKLILAISLILFLGFTLTNLINYHVSKDALHTSLVDESLPIISNNIYSEIQKDLVKPINVSSLMANDTFVKDWLLSGEQDIQPIQKYLMEIKNRYGFVSTFLISNKTLKYYHFQGLHKTIHPEDPHDDWYYDFLKTNMDYQLDVDTDEAANNNLTIFINHRLTDYEGGMIGVTGAGLSMNQIGEFLSKYKGQFNRNIYLVDMNGIVQVHQDLEQIRTANVFLQEGIQRHKEDILGNKTDLAFFEFDRAGKHILLITRFIPEFNWYLFVEQDETLTLAGIRHNLFRNLLIGLLITCAVIVINVFTINYFQGKLEHLASRDPLTGALNRREFFAKAKSEFARSKRYKIPLSMLMIDIDHFKIVNDTHGHAAGDRVLKQVARHCFSAIREGDIFGRIGGEEFAVALVETTEAKAKPVSERLRQSIETLSVDESGREIKATVSIGASEIKESDGDFESIMKRADAALYLAKAKGRNRVEIH